MTPATTHDMGYAALQNAGGVHNIRPDEVPAIGPV
jgi:hypothetical protein